ncbi:hypothetical protein [uncultured Cellulomonas sp.]|uniref:hypothetical protein n=1 Tax=uncultured Cellulomonas sp. TaxID=189682 RepID=UPI00260B3AB4|nr:hypothetical protein [uncultured Cellulomonas sp.]
MRSIRTKTLAVPIALAAAIGLAGCSDDSAGPEQGTDVEDVAEAEPGDMDEGGDLIGETVTVSGEITETIDPAGFWLGAGGGLFEEGAPVISTTGDFTGMGMEDPESLMDSDTVLQVTGTVAEFVVVDFEEEYGIDLDDDLWEDLDGEAVIVAEEVATLAGEDVTVEGEVYELVSTVAFRLAGAGWEVVVLDAEQASVEPGDEVAVQGTVRQLSITEIEEDYGVDLEDELYTDYEGELVLVADTVEEVAATE